MTKDLPGTGGVFGAEPDDFVVEEIPAYEPSGRGDHVFVTIEKRDLTTAEAIRRIARALGVREADVGAAGLKDRHAVTTQRLSLPPPVTPEAALALSLPQISVLAAARHSHKLKTGHLRGNRFVLRIRRTEVPIDEAAARADAILRALARPPGSPNWFGAQRFGRAGDNAARGRALVRGERVAVRDARERRLLVSAYQSELYNRYLAARLGDGAYHRVIEGDLLRKVDTGGLFPTVDPAIDQPRLERGEIAPTGPMFGHEMRSPAPGTEAFRREAAILDEEGLAPVDFVRVSRVAEGTRRPLGVPLGDAGVSVEADALVVRFALPSGAYATVVASELIKAEQPAPGGGRRGTGESLVLD